MSDIPQRPRPFADRLAVESIVTRAANDGSECICVLVEWEIGNCTICDTTIGTRAATNQTGAGMARNDIADVYHLPISDEEERGVIVAGNILGE